MSKVVFLKLEPGDFEQGFQVTLDIATPGKFPHVLGVVGGLRPAPELPGLYRDWQQKYAQLESSYRQRLFFTAAPLDAPAQVQACQLAAERLQQGFQDWLTCDRFRTIEQDLFADLDKSEAVRVILQTENDLLRRLPWEAWDFFQRYRNADLAVSPLLSYAPRPPAARSSVRILAILGDGEGIDVTADRKILEALPAAEVCFLVEPTRAQFDRLWQEPWDILFFAGHSASSATQGYLSLNRSPEGQLEISELAETLKAAIANRLQLAIFNSCDGLGLAHQLAKLHLPQVIVMREPVPDAIAQAFLKYFLTDLAQGTPLSIAVRRTRRILRELLQVDRDFPGVSWLPILCQNPAAPEFTWALPPARSPRWPIRAVFPPWLVSAVISGGIASGLTGWQVTQTTCPSPTEKREQGVCVRDLRQAPLVVAFLTSPHKDSARSDQADLALKHYLQTALGHQVRDIRIQAVDRISEPKTKEKLSEAEWDVVFAYSPINSWTAKQQGYTWLARMNTWSGRQNLGDRAFYRSVLFVPQSSHIRSIADIAPTTRVALGHVGSTSSFHLPIYTLYGKQMSATVGHAHEAIQGLVMQGKADVGASIDGYIALNPALRVIHASPPIPVAGVFLSPKLAAADRDRIARAFRAAPLSLKQTINYDDAAPEINYDFIGRVAAKSEEIMRCAHYFDRNPVQLFCN